MQLFHFVPCPRHRLPRYYYYVYYFANKPYKKLFLPLWLLWLIIWCRFDPQTGLLTGTNDMNLVNLFLRLFGRCTEKALCIRLLIFQAWYLSLSRSIYLHLSSVLIVVVVSRYFSKRTPIFTLFAEIPYYEVCEGFWRIISIGKKDLCVLSQSKYVPIIGL